MLSTLSREGSRTAHAAAWPPPTARVCPAAVSSILAHLFRQNSPRSPVPPSAFPSSLHSGSSPANAPPSRRLSRTELDFEEALRAGGTVLLKESLDVDALGADTTAASITLTASPSPPARGYRARQPATPIVVPPTPSPGNSAARPGVGPHPSPSPSPGPVPPPSATSLATASSSTSEVFYDAPEDTDYQTRRRSMYRSPGTASSPDLATLLRKAKERGGMGMGIGGGGGDGKDGKKSGSSSRERAFPFFLVLLIRFLVCEPSRLFFAWCLCLGLGLVQSVMEIRLKPKRRVFVCPFLFWRFSPFGSSSEIFAHGWSS